MANEKDQLRERVRSVEAEYLRGREQELAERARAHEAAAERRRLLSAALRVDDDALLTKILGLGFEAGTAPLLEVVPAIQVAWSDGSLPARERAEIERILARPEMAEAARLGSGMVAGWLSRQPAADLYRTATEALRLRLAHLDADSRKTLIERIIKDGHAVAAASGGVFGIGAHSSAESEIIRELAATLGVKS